MSDPFKDQPFPKGALIAGAVLIGVSLMTAATGRYVDSRESPFDGADQTETRYLTFEQLSEGGIAVLDYDSGDEIDVLAPGTNGFIRGVMRGLSRERQQNGVGPEHPYKLTYWSNGRYSLEDPSTDREIDLGAFGPTNVSAFARYLSVDHVEATLSQTPSNP